MRMRVGLRMKARLSGGSGRGSGVVEEELWEVGIMDRAEGRACGGVEAGGGVLCGGGAVSTGEVVGGDKSASGGRAIS